MKKNQVLCLLLAAILYGCGGSTRGGMEKEGQFDFTKLTGDWSANDHGIMIIERWNKAGNQLNGSSFNLKGSTMTVSETLTITDLAGTPIYTPTVAGQNNGQPIPFECRFQNERRIEFVNKQHDFPQVIRYELITPDSLVATVGLDPLDETTEKQVFKYTRRF